MERNNRTFNSHDIERIRGFLELATAKKGEKFRSLVQLKNDLAYSDVVAPTEMPHDVVTMNTEIRIEFTASGETKEVILVFPEEADFSKSKISLLAPLGAALLGCKRGETAVYTAPGGNVEVKIQEILYQPEANGDFES